MLPRIYRTDADIRKQQITTLKVFNANVNEITENIEYQVGFTAGKNTFALHISLGQDFPNEKPLLKVVPVVVHPWVNSEGDITTAPGLLNFTVHSDLGRVVQAIIREFERNPPPLAGETSHSSGTTTREFSSLRNHSPPSQMTIASNYSHQSHQQYHPRLVLFPELNSLSLEELKELGQNEDLQQALVEECPAIKEQTTILDDVILQVEELAEANLSRQEHLEEMRIRVDSRLEEVTKLAFENERLHSIYKNMSEKYTPRSIQEYLRTASKKADEDSEHVAEAFLKGELDLDKFVSTYVKSRMLYQTRRTKEEKLTHQIDSLEKAGF